MKTRSTLRLSHFRGARWILGRAIVVALVIGCSIIGCPTAHAQNVCLSDVDGDGTVNGRDLASVLSNWGPCSGCAADTNSDGLVDAVDLAAVLARWGGTCPPTATSLSPAAGPIAGGAFVTIVGDRLLDPLAVTFGGAVGTVVSSTRTSIVVVAPARRAGASSVVVTTAGGSAAAGTFTYFGSPTISTVSPNTGSAGGGQLVTLTGTGFYGAPSVTFGSIPSPTVTVLSSTQLTAVTPPGLAGVIVPVAVNTTAGTATMTFGYLYAAAVVPSWATLIEANPAPSVVGNAALRVAILSTGYAWRVRDNATQIEMVLVPPGSFNMGCSSSEQYLCQQNELPIHPVTLTSPFYMSRHEVTQAQWTARMGSNPSLFQGASYPDAALRPVEQVSWVTVQDYLAATGFRLPTEAEWEYAYRAGTTTAFHSMPGYPNGTANDALVGAIAWFDGNAGGQTRAVGQKAPNMFGLYDMSGNVAEWVSDWYSDAYYASGAQTNPLGPVSGTSRVFRGGAWADATRWLTSSSRRFGYAPTGGASVVGFRVARNP